MRVNVKKIKDFPRFKNIIEQCYTSDEDLSEKYHALAPASPQQCIDHTLNYAVESSKASVLTFWELEIDGKFVAYFGQQIFAEKNYFLFGFFIIEQYRTPEFKQKFWRVVKSKFPGKVDCMIYSKNTRAIQFLKHSGFKCIRVDLSFENRPAEQWVWLP